MPIAPHFTLDQTDTTVTIEIAVPHVRVCDVEYVLTDDDTCVHFATTPALYLLVLSFAPHRFVGSDDEISPDDDDQKRAQFDPLLRHGTVRLELPKRDVGHWADLDLIGRLQQPRRQSTGQHDQITRRNGNWLVAVESSSTNELDGDDDGAVHGLDRRRHEDEKQVEDDHDNDGGGLYGFARMFHGIFTDLARDGLAREMLELPWNDEDDTITAMVSRQDDDTLSRVHIMRRRERMQMEREKFCPDRYLGDTFGSHDDYLYQCAMAMRPHWTTTTTQNEAPMNDTAADNTTLSSSTSLHYFDQQEQSLLLSIPYPLLPDKVLQPQQQRQQGDYHPHRRLMLPLVDILFAYVYDHLLTDGEPTVESAWTVSTLSATLAALEDWSDDDDGDKTYNDDDADSAENRNMTRPVVESCLRRSLVYPYLRSFDFALHVMDHVVQILRRGLRTVIRCLLHVRRILDRSELYYLGNKIFVDPYLAWLQKCSNVVNFDEWMMQTAGEIERIVAPSGESMRDLRESIGLGLVAIENGVVEAGAATNASSSREDEDADDSSSSSSSSSYDDSTATTSVGDEHEPAVIEEVSVTTTTTTFVSEQIGNLRI